MVQVIAYIIITAIVIIVVALAAVASQWLAGTRIFIRYGDTLETIALIGSFLLVNSILILIWYYKIMGIKPIHDATLVYCTLSGFIWWSDILFKLITKFKR